LFIFSIEVTYRTSPKSLYSFNQAARYNKGMSNQEIIEKIKLIKINKRHIIYGVLMSSLLLISSFSLLSLSPYQPNGTSQYFRAKVISVKADDSRDYGPEQNAKVKLLDGPEINQIVVVQRSNGIGDKAAKRLPVGSEVLLYKDSSNGDQYSLIARWHMPGIATLFILLLVLVVVIGAWRGITSVFGLTISVFILAAFVLPNIVAGHSALMTCIEGAVLITVVSVFVAHGFTKRTTMAFVGSIFTLVLVIGLTGFASYVTGTSEVIGEETIGVQYATHPIDVAGLLTGGVIIASLGTLFDITTGQAATVDEIYKANRKQTSRQLFWKGMSVG
jgi:uncharacterized membrane protein